MIRLGLRLTLAGGREAVVRLVTIAVAVALGVGLLLVTLAGVNAVHAQNDRYAWLATSSEQSQRDGSGAHDPLWWRLRGDFYDGHTIGRVDVAATGPDAPVPPGIPALPGPGEYYASPAMRDLLESEPADQLADRYPGRAAGTIGSEALPSPDSLIIVSGYTPGELADQPGATKVTGIGTTVPAVCDGCLVGTPSAGMDLILGVVAAALLFPVLIFIGTATRLAATRREQRFAALRLVGATPRQVSVVSAVESTAAALAGTAAGFGLFLLLRHPLAAIPFTGLPFYPADLSLGMVDMLLVAVGVPVGAAVAARIALRRVRISPLGVTRRVAPRPPRAYRLIPLVAGLGELGYFVGRVPETSNGQLVAFLSGFLLTMVGLVVAGPWLTMVGSRLLARRSSRPATLIAARRLADNPQAGFRAISGPVLALFVTSVAVGVITTIIDNRGTQWHGETANSTLSAQFWAGDSDAAGANVVPDGVVADLSGTDGVRDVTVVRHNPSQNEHNDELPGLVPCTDLPAEYGRCAEGAEVVQVWSALIDFGRSDSADTVWPAADRTVAELRELPVLSVVVGTDGSTRALERSRTILEGAYPGDERPPSTDADNDADFTQALTGWQQLANVVILASLPIAGCSLAVSVAGGLAERKRPFSLLRLSGVPLRVLRRVVALESAVPLLAAAAVAVGTGFLAAHLFLTAQMDYTLRAPGLEYYLIVVAGLVASLAVIASTLPLLERITGPETARNE